MNLIQNYLTESGCYKAGKHITVKGLMIHSVGCPQLLSFDNQVQWSKSNRYAELEAWIFI